MPPFKIRNKESDVRGERDGSKDKSATRKNDAIYNAR